ncbi:hypothetical protein GUJ93_ZPchr0006g45331 [Zizania palustris]|uniref:Uncharacterized protein n=1 Tax=Zizania palustris TaxID=103762 RepID=A0A8J5T2G2_ZIZPA|nr:hypothetical protein GUJ93_ZPchr0006g45331 [Zizania palustris]
MSTFGGSGLRASGSGCGRLALALSSAVGLWGFGGSPLGVGDSGSRPREELCEDIRRGVLSTTRVTTPAVRQAMSALLTAPNPDLADAVARKCAVLSNWYGVIPALWPNAKYVYGIMTGSMEHYVKKLRHYAGGLPLVAAEYGSSELGIRGVGQSGASPLR